MSLRCYAVLKEVYNGNMPATERSSLYPFVLFSEQEGPHKVHYVLVPIGFPELSREEEFERQMAVSKLQRVTIDHEFGWGNEEDSERIRFIVPNTPALQAEDGNYYLEDHIIREYTESLTGIGDIEESLQNLLEAIPDFGEENLQKLQDYAQTSSQHPWFLPVKPKSRRVHSHGSGSSLE